MSFLQLKTTECRVGVLGLANAGKTVLITAIVDHLEHHDPDRFRLGRSANSPAVVRRFQRIPADPGWQAFDAIKYRDALVHKGRWPEKTRDRSQFVCRFKRSDWKYSDCLLKLHDLPGERLADAAMHGRSFADWSDYLLAAIESDTPHRKLYAPFLDIVTSSDVNESDFLRAYKLSLANSILSFKPLISPSTFLLDVSGVTAKPMSPADLAGSRLAGLEAGQEFAPLPAETRASRPDLASQFASRFERYRDSVVQPFLDALQACHTLVVAFDVPTILAGGVGMYDDFRQILRDLFVAIDPGESTVGKVCRHLAHLLLPHGQRPAWVTRIAFVASKADLVHPQDRDRLLGLLRRIVGKLAADRDGLIHDFFNCAAVVSARPLPGDGRFLVGIPYREATGKRLPPGHEQRFRVSALPDDWPADWSAGEFVYPEVYPVIPARKDCPPDHLNLDKVLNFVLG